MLPHSSNGGRCTAGLEFNWRIYHIDIMWHLLSVTNNLHVRYATCCIHYKCRVSAEQGENPQVSPIVVIPVLTYMSRLLTNGGKCWSSWVCKRRPCYSVPVICNADVKKRKMAKDVHICYCNSILWQCNYGNVFCDSVITVFCDSVIMVMYFVTV